MLVNMTLEMQPSKNIRQNSCFATLVKIRGNSSDGFHGLIKLQGADLQLHSKRASPPAYLSVAEKLQCERVF